MVLNMYSLYSEFKHLNNALKCLLLQYQQFLEKAIDCSWPCCHLQLLTPTHLLQPHPPSPGSCSPLHWENVHSSSKMHSITFSILQLQGSFALAKPKLHFAEQKNIGKKKINAMSVKQIKFVAFMKSAGLLCFTKISHKQSPFPKFNGGHVPPAI